MPRIWPEQVPTDFGITSAKVLEQNSVDTLFGLIRVRGLKPKINRKKL
jgi:hypothetical protein